MIILGYILQAIAGLAIGWIACEGAIYNKDLRFPLVVAFVLAIVGMILT